MDREKVIKGLECCKNKTMLWQHDQCPYHGFDEDCESNLHADAIALLKEQEARWISVPHKIARICSHCEADEPYKFADDDAEVYKYCPHCGAKMTEGR